MAKERIAYWDNMKAILIFLVVLGHFLLSISKKDSMVLGLGYYIYLFHMPAFVFVSGFFSKRYINKLKATGEIEVNKIAGYLCLYVILNLMIWLVSFIFHGTSLFSIDLLRMEGAPWYLLAMVI